MPGILPSKCLFLLPSPTSHKEYPNKSSPHHYELHIKLKHKKLPNTSNFMFQSGTITNEENNLREVEYLLNIIRLVSDGSTIFH